MKYTYFHFFATILLAIGSFFVLSGSAEFVFPKLSYTCDALEPHLSKELVCEHYEHSKKYSELLNALLRNHSHYRDYSVESLVSGWKKLPEEIREQVRDTAGGYLNHLIFWRSMAPAAQFNEVAFIEPGPKGRLAEGIISAFGSFDEFKKQFVQAALSVVGSGWVWLCVNNEGKLFIVPTANQENPLSLSLKPLLGLDLWEHAYHGRYAYDRVEYITAWWSLVNWHEVSRLYDLYNPDSYSFKGIVIVAGIAGDLGKRKILPALYQLVKKGSRGIIIGTGRQALSVDDLIKRAREFIIDYDEETGALFKNLLYYQRLDAQSLDSFKDLARFIDEREKSLGLSGERIIYLSTPADTFCQLTRQLVESGIVITDNARHRIAYEKPFGWNLESARETNQCISAILNESQVYRIDHYLAKGLVARLLSLRSANTLLASVWRPELIESISIYFDEALGLEGRGSFYDRYGALRDVVQNHILQLIALSAVDAQDGMASRALCQRKVALLKALSLSDGILGQYEGYVKEPDVAPESLTDTFVWLKLFIDTDQWRHVPFYVRTGKLLGRKFSGIEVIFKTSDKLILEIAPHAGISAVLHMQDPVLGISSEFAISSKSDDFSFPDAYEVIFSALMHGVHSVDVSLAEIEAQWDFAERVQRLNLPLKIYQPGSFGPREAVMPYFATA